MTPTDATKAIVGHTVQVLTKCGVGQIRQQVEGKKPAVLIKTAMDIITNVWVHAAFDLKQTWIEKNNIY